MTKLTAKVPLAMAGMRLDQALAGLFADYSRSKLRGWVEADRVKVNGLALKPRTKLEGGETIDLDAEAEAVVTAAGEDIPLDIVHEDHSLLVVNKPAGLVVHPAIGNWRGTLLNALLNHHPALETLPRAGIVHRLDKDTSGLLMVAKTLSAHHSLTVQLRERQIDRGYLAVVRGQMIAGGTVDAPIGRHPTERTRYAVSRAGKPAVTHYRVVRRFARHTVVQVSLETGRTHQIRVHMAHIRHPLLGDPLYGGRFQMPAASSGQLQQVLRDFRRQALHAAKLGLAHPETGDPMAWEQPPPADMRQLLQALADNEQP